MYAMVIYNDIFKIIVELIIFQYTLKSIIVTNCTKSFFLSIALLLLYLSTAWSNILHYILVSVFNILWGSKLKVWFQVCFIPLIKISGCHIWRRNRTTICSYKWKSCMVESAHYRIYTLRWTVLFMFAF